MDTADENGGGGAPVDRGDNFTPANPAPAEPAAPIVDEQSAGEQPSADEQQPTGETPPDETPRDSNGKFTKKERDDGPTIPKARFDEQIAKERTAREAAERRANELESSIIKANRDLDVEKAENDVADLRKQERKALLDGDEDKAAQLSTQADLLNRQIAIAQSQSMTAQAKEDALEDMRMELTIERMEEKYPQLRTGEEGYDQDLVDDILDKQDGLMRRERLSPSRALAKAVESVMKRQEKAHDDTDKDERTGLAAAAAVTTDRKAASVARNVDAATRQPSPLKDAGLDADKAGQTKPIPSATTMSLEELMALPETTRAKMRGDMV